MWPPWRSNGSTTARGTRRASCARSSCRRPSSASPCAWPSSCRVSRRSQQWRWVPGFTQQRSFLQKIWILESHNFPTNFFSPEYSCQPIHKASSDFVRVGRAHFSLRMTTRSQTGHSDMQTPFCHRQGSVQSASMGEHEIRLERFLLKHLICQRNTTTKYLRHQHVWGHWGGSSWVFTLPTKHHHKWQAEQEVFMWGWNSGRYTNIQPFGIFQNALRCVLWIPLVLLHLKWLLLLETCLLVSWSSHIPKC